MTDNVYNGRRPLFDKYIPGGQLVDVSAPSISYAPIPAAGIVRNAFCTISAAVTSLDSTVTIKKISGSTTTTLGTITVANSGSAAGSTFEAVLTASKENLTVKMGDTIVFDSDGASSTTSIANFVLVLREAG